MPIESSFQRKVLDRIQQDFPEAVILKNDSGYLQGIPDFVIFYYGCYAMLEFKASRNATVQPNQKYYVDLFSAWAYAAFVHPGNVEQVMYDLQLAFRFAR